MKVGPLLNRTLAMVTWDMEKAEVLNAFLGSVFFGIRGLQESQALDMRGKSEARSMYPWWKKNKSGKA